MSTEDWFEVSIVTIGPDVSLIAEARPFDDKAQVRFFIQQDNEEARHEITRELAETLIAMRQLKVAQT